MSAKELVQDMINKLEGKIAELTQEIRAGRENLQLLIEERETAGNVVAELKALIGE